MLIMGLKNFRNQFWVKKVKIRNNLKIRQHSGVGTRDQAQNEATC